MVINVTNQLIAKGLLRISDAVSFIVTSSGARLIDQRTMSWTNSVYHEFTVSWDSGPSRAENFATGGQIRFSADRVGGSSNNQNDSRTVLLSKMGTIVFDFDKTFLTGSQGIVAGTGNAGVTGFYTQIFQAMSDSYYYATDQYRIDVKSDSPEQITFSIMQQDAADRLIHQVTDGTLTSYIDSRHHIDSIPLPVFSTVTSMAAGS